MDTFVGASILTVTGIAQFAYWRAHARPVDVRRAPAPSLRVFRFVYPALMLALFAVGLDLVCRGGPATRTVVPPPWLAVAGVVAMGCGLLVFAWARRSLGAEYSPCHASRRPNRVVRSGAYRYLRHPMYAGNLLAIAGAVLASGAALLAILWVVVALCYRRAARDEDALLRTLAPREGGACAPHGAR